MSKLAAHEDDTDKLKAVVDLAFSLGNVFEAYNRIMHRSANRKVIVGVDPEVE